MKPSTAAMLLNDTVAQQLAAIVESSDDAIISKDLNGVIQSWNAAATRIFGHTAEEMVGQSILRLIPPELHHEEDVILSRLRAGLRVDHYETRRLHKNGHRIDVSLSVSPIPDSSGRVVGAAKIARDITQRKLTEAALIQAEKLAALGRMAAVVAHEVNNPLEAITNLAYLLATHPALDAQAREYATTLLREVDRVNHITRQTLAFYRDPAGPSEVDLSHLLDNLLEFYRPRLERDRISVFTRYRGAVHVEGFAGELRQVFANLLLNAVDALPFGGRIQVRTFPVRCRALPAQPSGVRVILADNGAGIPRKQLPKIFDPFFTTKGNRGSGLGLWVTQGILRKHGGVLRLRSSTRPGRSGTVFSVFLPFQKSSALLEPAA